MINSKSLENTAHYKQRGLWEIVIPDPGPTIKASMNEAVKCCALSRDQIVDEMNGLALAAGITCNGRCQRVTLSMLDKWLAHGSTAYFIPIRLLPLFCRVVGSNLPLKALSSFFEDVRIISAADVKKLRWAEAEINIRKNRKNARLLAQEVGL